MSLGAPPALDGRTRLYAFHEAFAAKALTLMKAKNQDYATEADPLLNFRIGGLIGIAIRMSDKVVRLVNLIRKGKMAEVAETIEDSALDLINYAIILIWADREGMK